MKERADKRATFAAILLTVVAIAALMMHPGWKRRGHRGYAALMSSSAVEAASEFGPWKEAVEKVKEDRGEPTGKQAKVDIPPELSHYSDTRRFLAVQVAEWREHRFETPHDFVDLARMIKRGEMVELKPVSENYILFGVGGSTDTEPFTHYDRSSGKRIALYSESELAREYARLADARTKLEEEIGGLREQLASTGKRQASARRKLQAQISAKEKLIKAEREKAESLDSYYGDAETRRQLLADHEILEGLATDFSGRTYDITDPRSRQEMKVRMLSYLRPEALKVLEEIASSYQQKFDRPLPVTSLVRPDEYQHMLSKVNPNATRIETPPHSTGLAFDIYYRFMTAEEQSHVMAHLALLKDEGRIEVLRENRDHYHVFAFVDAARPAETLISESLGKSNVVKSTKKIEVHEQVSKKENKRDVRKKETRKEAAKKQQNRAKGKRR